METIKARNDLFDFRKMVDSSKEKNIKADLSANAELEEKIAYKLKHLDFLCHVYLLKAIAITTIVFLIFKEKPVTT